MIITTACSIGKHAVCPGNATNDDQSPAGPCECPCHPSRIALVVWKDEGDFGFITTLTARDLADREANPGALGVPYDPDRVRAYGSLDDARALAREHGVEVEVG